MVYGCLVNEVLLPQLTYAAKHGNAPVGGAFFWAGTGIKGLLKFAGLSSPSRRFRLGATRASSAYRFLCRRGSSFGLARVVNSRREGMAVHFVPAYMPNLSLGPATNSGAFLLV
jgi:hypothetical protein